MMLYFLKDAQIFEKIIDEIDVYYGHTFPTTILSLLVDLRNAENKEIYHTDKYLPHMNFISNLYFIYIKIKMRRYIS